MGINGELMDKAVNVEKKDKRDFYLAEALIKEGLGTFEIGEEDKYADKEFIYVRSIVSEVSEDFARNMKEGAVLFSRGVNEEVKTILSKKNIVYYNLLDDETFIVKNAYITAEGALGHIIFNTETTIRQMPVLVLGYGRVGKSVTKLLRDNYSVVSVATDDPAEYAIASLFSDDVLTLSNFKNKLKNFSVVINTIPKLILEGETLSLINKDCFILDLASKPGGVDYETAEKLNLKVLHALGVPGKVAPKTAGLYIKDIIMRKLSK